MAFFLCLERKSMAHIARPLPTRRSAPATLKPLPAFAHPERVRNSSPRAVTIRYIWAIISPLGFAAFLNLESFIKNGLKTSGIFLSLIRKYRDALEEAIIYTNRKLKMHKVHELCQMGLLVMRLRPANCEAIAVIIKAISTVAIG